MKREMNERKTELERKKNNLSPNQEKIIKKEYGEILSLFKKNTPWDQEIHSTPQMVENHPNLWSSFRTSNRRCHSRMVTTEFGWRDFLFLNVFSISFVNFNIPPGFLVSLGFSFLYGINKRLNFGGE